MKTVILGGIGKLDARGERIVRHALASADGFLMRTPRDARIAQELSGGARPVRLLPDGALWLEAGADSKSDLPRNNTIVFAFRGNGEIPKASKEIAAVAQKRWGLTPVFAAMQAKRDEARGKVADLLGARALPHLPPCELIGVMGKSRVVVGDRLHALILAAAAGVPAVGISDGGKIDAFCDFCADCGGGARISAVSYSELEAAVERAISLPESDGGLLSALRQRGENFSFADFFALL